AVPTLFSAFLIFDTHGRPVYQKHTSQFQPSQANINSLEKMLHKHHQNIVIYDEIEDENSHVKLMMRQLEIAVIASLSTRNEKIGYVIFGNKRTGTAFTSQDIKLFNTVSRQLAIALQNTERFEEIQSFNATLQSKVEDATQALRRTNKKLVALDDAKDEFISMASHQLRTPLTSIKGYISMLLEGDLGKLNETQKKALKESFDSSQRMVFLISDFLNVSRIRTGRFIIEPTPTNLCEIVSSELSQLNDMARVRQVSLSFTPPKSFPVVMLDENKIRQVMMNMIDNAIFYTPSGGTITISLEINKQELAFKVIDNGIGVPTADKHRLFTKFFRASNAQRARPDGTGLGLFMAQKVVHEQGGKVIFESVETKGSTFCFHFPLAKSQVK
ncbi:MAG: GAF domain-containing sensor histidine kinase, partial [Segetibacter sp.]